MLPPLLTALQNSRPVGLAAPLRDSELAPALPSVDSPGPGQAQQRLGLENGTAPVDVALLVPHGSSNQAGHRTEQSLETQQPSILARLISSGQVEPFIDGYVSLFHQLYPIVHEATFRAQLMEVIPRPAGNAWQVLLLVLAAIGALTTSSQPHDIDIALFEAAKTILLMDMIDTGSLLLVQALALISQYLQKRNKPQSAYNFIGLAKRMAMGIDLHKELSTSENSPFEMEMRRTIWYCLYVFDTESIIVFSRPLDLPSDDGIAIQLPMNVFDSVIIACTFVR